MTNEDQSQVETLLQLARCYRVAADTCSEMARQISEDKEINAQAMADFSQDLAMIERARARLKDV